VEKDKVRGLEGGTGEVGRRLEERRGVSWRTAGVMCRAGVTGLELGETEALRMC
jgi:hypothetical protein